MRVFCGAKWKGVRLARDLRVVWSVVEGGGAGKCYARVSVERRGKSRVAGTVTRPQDTFFKFTL